MKNNRLTAGIGVMMLTAVASWLFVACNTGNARPTGALTNPLEASAWDVAKWISVVDCPVVEGPVTGPLQENAAEGASWFLSTVTNEAKVTNATWMTTGLGTYQLFVNGQPVGEEVLKPGFTHPFKTKRSFTYDITDLFNCKKGAENTLSAQVTPGWWADKIVTPDGHDGMIGRKCAFRAVLQLTFANGTTCLYGTDLDNWKAGIAGPVTRAGIFDGEEYDARIPMGFDTPERLSTPEENTEFTGEILPTDGAEIYQRHDLALKPVRAYVWKDVEGRRMSDDDQDGENCYGKVIVLREYQPGEHIQLNPEETLVIDFGQNCAGVPEFTFRAVEGTVLTCLPGEILNDGNGLLKRGMDGPEGSVHRKNLRKDSYFFRLKYTFAGKPEGETYCPQCTFFGYRYISVTATDTVRILSAASVPVTSISKDMETGTISTGDASVNQLISNTLWGMRSNYLSVPTDCPQRDERQGWTADTQVFSETGTFFANTARFFHKWMRDLRDTQSPQGGFPGVAPWGQYYDAGMMRVGWADAGIIVPWTVWKQFGDTAIISENWEAMDRYMQHINATRYDHRTLRAENDNYQWGDWLSYEALESHDRSAFDDNGPLPETVEYWNFLCASYWALDAGMMADMAEATGHDATPYRAMESEAKNYLRTTFLNDDGTFKAPILNTMQTPALFALENDLLEDEAEENLKARLRENFAQHDGCLQTGFLGTSILLPTLSNHGMSDLAYDLLFQRKNPSWLYSVDNGATTIWERWNSYMADKGVGPQDMNSFNHYAYGVVCQWLWEYVAGIAADPAQPGFKHIIMSPVPDKRLGFVKAEYRSAAGLIKSHWRYEGDEWIWTFTIPEGATASITLPGEKESTEYTAGTYTCKTSTSCDR